MVEMHSKRIEKRMFPSVAYRGMLKVNSEEEIFACDIHPVRPCANGLHVGVNSDCKSS